MKTVVTSQALRRHSTVIPVNDMPTGSPDVSLPDGLEDTTYTVSIADLLVGLQILMEIRSQ